MGPCLCGDPYCHSCGNPSAAKLEAAYDNLIEKINEFGLNSDEEFQLFLDVGIQAVKSARILAENAVKEYRASEAEANFLKDNIYYEQR